MKYPQITMFFQLRYLSGKKYFRPKDIARAAGIRSDHARQDLHRCWKMGLLRRKKVTDYEHGGFYNLYYLSRRGRRYTTAHGRDTITPSYVHYKIISAYGMIKSKNAGTKWVALFYYIPLIRNELGTDEKGKEYSKILKFMKLILYKDLLAIPMTDNTYAALHELIIWSITGFHPENLIPD